jgi:hypothetical protein
MRKGPWQWVKNTEPFSAIDHPNQPARFVVEQISDDEFDIPPGLGFQYNPPGEPPIKVTGTTLPRTDFASIPRYMAWFVSRYGRHTPAALVHDQQVSRGMPFEERKRADHRFLEMMDSLEVPPVQSRVMWAAVTLATRRTGTPRSKAGFAAWVVVAAGGIGLLAWGVATFTPRMIVVALVLPAVAAAFWGDQYWAGLVAGYALPVVALPALASLFGYWIYWTFEYAVKLVRQRLEHNRSKELAKPIGYQGR